MKVKSASNRFWSITASFEITKKDGPTYRFVPATDNILYLEKYENSRMVSRTDIGFDEMDQLARKNEEVKEDGS